MEKYSKDSDLEKLGPPNWFFWICGSIAFLIVLLVIAIIVALVVLLWGFAL